MFESDDTTEPAGTVFRQSPEANQTPPAGTTITIFVSTFVEPTDPHGRPPTADAADVPDVAGDPATGDLAAYFSGSA